MCEYCPDEICEVCGCQLVDGACLYERKPGETVIWCQHCMEYASWIHSCRKRNTRKTSGCNEHADRACTCGQRSHQ